VGAFLHKVFQISTPEFGARACVCVCVCVSSSPYVINGSISTFCEMAKIRNLSLKHRMVEHRSQINGDFFF
jgi:hypothetical protein